MAILSVHADNHSPSQDFHIATGASDDLYPLKGKTRIHICF